MNVINFPKNEKIKRNRISDNLNIAIVEHINIYNQAYIQLERPLIKVSVVHDRTKYEIPVVFKIAGDIKGEIICLLDTYKKNQHDTDFFKSLYIESMNILLGKMMTNLETRTGIIGLLSTPYTPSTDILSKLLLSTRNTGSLSMGYKMVSNGSDYDCRIIFNINNSKFTEV